MSYIIICSIISLGKSTFYGEKKMERKNNKVKLSEQESYSTKRGEFGVPDAPSFYVQYITVLVLYPTRTLPYSYI